MRVSLSWIRRILGSEQLPLSAQDLFDRVTLRLAEIDELERTGPQLDGVVVGKVLTCEQHPDADRLRVTTVDVGADEPLPIVCGAPNVAAGQHVAVATVGTKLSMPDKNGELQSITIKKGKLRGQPSHGMICAEDELGLGTSHDGIMVLDGEPALGTPLTDVVQAGDDVFVVDNHNINHRPDLWGHLGWAREIAAICDLPAPAAPNISVAAPAGDMSVHIEDDGCRGYVGACIDGVENIASPQWMQDVLTAAGVRPLGFLVDITNYVMLELGEPMHAFDRRQIAGNTITVRAANEGETMTTLDESEVQLQPSDMLIADSEKPLALAGIMGGAHSGVADDTTSIVLEAAIFDPARIRKTRIRTGIATDSSNRFEKNLYPEGAAAAINRAIELITEVFPNAVVSGHFHSGTTAQDAPVLEHNPQSVERFVGLNVPAEQQFAILATLGCAIENNTVTVPWWRAKDVAEPIDLVEEIVRLYGFEHIEPAPPLLPAATPTPNPLRQAEHRSRHILSREGWDEVQTYGFTSTAWAERLEWPSDKLIHLQHPLAADQSVMRWQLLPTLAEAAARNLRHSSEVSIYEVGKRYGQDIGRAPTVDEVMQVAGVHASTTTDDSPFYAARDAALAIIDGLGYKARLAADESPLPGFTAGRSAVIRVGKAVVAHIGELTTDTAEAAGTSASLAAFIIDLEPLVLDSPAVAPLAFTAPSRYQDVEREFTWVCPESLEWSALESASTSGAGKLFKGIELVTIYRGDQIPEGHKAVSLKVTLQADDRTLSEKDLKKAQNGIIKTVEHKTGAKLRA